MSRIFFFSLLNFILVFSEVVEAEIFKWKDENGKIHFGDKVPEKYQGSEKSLDGQPVNIIKNNNPPPIKKKKHKTDYDIYLEREHFERKKLRNAIRNGRKQMEKSKNKKPSAPKKPLSCADLPSKAVQIKCARKQREVI